MGNTAAKVWWVQVALNPANIWSRLMGGLFDDEQACAVPWKKILCLDVAHPTERSLDMASRAWSSDEENSTVCLVLTVDWMLLVQMTDS